MDLLWHLSVMITPDQIRAARALLRIEQADLARRAKVSVSTIRRIESAKMPARVQAAAMTQIRGVLEQAGAEFIEDGVRRRRPTREDPEVVYSRLKAIAAQSAAALADAPPFSEDDLYDENGLPR